MIAAGTKKRVLDIEDVLSWALREELPKRRDDKADDHRPFFPSVSPMFRNAALGARVDCWNREPGFPLALGEPHPDALIVEQHIRSLERYRSHIHKGDAGLAPDFTLDVDEGAAMSRAWPTIDLLVIVNARLSRRPPWDVGPSPTAVLAGNNKPAVLAPTLISDAAFGGGETVRIELTPSAPIRAGVYRDGAACPLTWSPAPQSIVVERAEYAVWWAAIDLLAHELQGKLATISVLPPSAPQRPWAGDRELGKPVRIYEDLRARAHLKEKREWEAARRLHAKRRPRVGHVAAARAPARRRRAAAA